ncbi:MAG: NifB/NifX family molybdenum-iron cluster-binding protein [Lachnospiraceae bacterium]|nr:NifB/NifX family molybdenum-iron cluster-binding protein [Lachnospiraceae bacterium]
MRIAIPLDENKQDVCVVLARAPYFLFRDGEEELIVENPAARAQGGAGIQVAQFLVDNDIQALITVRCGQNAADVFTSANIKIYKSVRKTAAEELAAFAEGKLEELTSFHGGFHGTHGS